MNININIRERSDNKPQKSALSLSFSVSSRPTEYVLISSFMQNTICIKRERKQADKQLLSSLQYKSPAPSPPTVCLGRRMMRNGFLCRQCLNFPFYPLLMWADLKRKWYWDNLKAAGIQQGFLKGPLAKCTHIYASTVNNILEMDHSLVFIALATPKE